jgi:hypothetical protein
MGRVLFDCRLTLGTSLQHHDLWFDLFLRLILLTTIFLCFFTWLVNLFSSCCLFRFLFLLLDCLSSLFAIAVLSSSLVCLTLLVLITIFFTILFIRLFHYSLSFCIHKILHKLKGLHHLSSQNHLDLLVGTSVAECSISFDDRLVLTVSAPAWSRQRLVLLVVHLPLYLLVATLAEMVSWSSLNLLGEMTLFVKFELEMVLVRLYFAFLGVYVFGHFV